PSSGFSATKTTRKGAPFHGEIGEGKIASLVASSQPLGEPWACESTTEKNRTKNAPATANNAFAAAASLRTRSERSMVSDCAHALGPILMRRISPIPILGLCQELNEKDTLHVVDQAAPTAQSGRTDLRLRSLAIWEYLKRTAETLC